MSANPKLLIADEPTTALDVTTQNKILTLMKNLQKEHHTSILMISHDITVIGQQEQAEPAQSPSPQPSAPAETPKPAEETADDNDLPF